jgi:thiamine pyrophosphate-dependent acetolactate synthase large subunit-like protein
VFGLLGDGNLSWVAAMAQHPEVRLIDARDEGAALLMADGWARATGEVGVCNATQGPGLTRMTTSLVTVTRSRSPVVVYTSKTHFNDEHVNQALNQERLVSATGAGYIEVLTPDYAEEAVRQAFYRARLDSRPIVLCYPLDIQERECEGDDDYPTSSALFTGQQRIRPAQDRLEEAVKIVASSRRPVVLVGRGAVRSGAVASAERLARRIGALIATTLVAKGTLAGTDYHVGIAGLFSTRTAMQLFDEADCVIAIGASLNHHTLEGGLLFPNARIVHIDAARTVLMGNDRLAHCYVQGDAAISTEALDELLAQRGVSGEGFRTPAVRRALANADRDPAEYEIESGTVDPREASRIIDERLPEEVGVVIGVGHSFAFPVMVMKRPRVLHEFVNGFGCIGETLPVAIGMGVAQGGKPLALIEGDGGAMQNIQELDTAARLGVKLLFIILNDEGLGAEYQKARAKGFDPNLAVVRSPDFGAVARGFGCRGRVARTLEEVAAGIDEFLAGAGPMVLDVRISRNVVAITYRRVHYGEDA